jgi:hypothetical protein
MNESTWSYLLTVSAPILVVVVAVIIAERQDRREALQRKERRSKHSLTT